MTVWNMKRNPRLEELHKRAYRSHCVLKKGSVDAMDIKDLSYQDDGFRSMRRKNEPKIPLQKLPDDGTDIQEVRKKLKRYFLTLDEKTRVFVPYELQPRFADSFW